jgi:hypothetical protein
MSEGTQLEREAGLVTEEILRAIAMARRWDTVRLGWEALVRVRYLHSSLEAEASNMDATQSPLEVPR